MPHHFMLNRSLAQLGQSPTVAINDLSNRLLAEGKSVIKFGLGQSPFPVPQALVEALRRHAHEKDYLPVAGLPKLREAVALHTATEVPGFAPSADDVIIAPGSKELIFLAQLVFEGHVLVPNPSWVSYVPQAKIVGRSFSWVETHEASRWMISAQTLASAAANIRGPKLLILNYPSNPTGSTFDAAELAALADVCREHGIVVISDEIYGRVDHHAQHRSLAEFYPEGTIVSGGLSKWCGAGGWRLGTFVFPAALRSMRDAMCVVASETYTSVSAPIQHAAIEGFRDTPALLHYLQASRAVLAAVGAHAVETLRASKVTLPDVRGGFYLFANFEAHREALAKRGITDASALCQRLLDETGVAILPGEAFGRPPHELTARLAFVDFDGQGALEAYAQAGISSDFVIRHASRVAEGMNRIAAWLDR